MTKQTFLHDNHVALGGKMVDFAGWTMPVQYKTTIIEEHNTVRTSVGLFDVSHMGEIIVDGRDAEAFLNKLVPQDITSLDAEGKAIYCQLTNYDGGLIDDLIIYKLKETKYLIVANASRIDEDINWMARNSLEFNVEITDVSYRYSMIAVQGPKSIDLMNKIGNNDLPTFFSIKNDEVFGIDMWISRTGYTGEDGVELIMLNEFVVEVWERLLEEGAELGIKPIGLGARDTLRLEASMPLYGHEMDETITTIEAGLGWSLPKKKIINYNGKAKIEEQLKNGAARKSVAIKMLDRGIARNGYEVFYKDEKIGYITSGGISPTRGDNIALAIIKNIDEVSVGTIIQVCIREKMLNAEVIKKPFIEKRNKPKE